ncbi:hypothetical protein [Microbacterium rhizosphaerae]|jgi:hypothetical protein|uniref:Uncharacterized protein n=1 Tax=Microbacterium rhizosphaerae TaxID=1678237 RepID=A0ABZ0STJ3_9MICO|nr:hypothetical protein [Microbacterium rhizosphaerae]WPR90706.1 hypothetical protein SM116_05285 [Microbacterium rhizosphaerae]
MHQRRSLIVGIALHAVLLAALICGMLLDLTAGRSPHLGPVLIAAYVCASLVITTVMFWPAVVPRRRPGRARASR